MNDERIQWIQFNSMRQRKFSKTSKLLAERKQWTQLNRMEKRKWFQTKFFKLKESNECNSMGRKKGNAGTNKLLAERKNSFYSTEQKEGMRKEYNEFNWNRMKRRKCSRTNKLLDERKQWVHFNRMEDIISGKIFQAGRKQRSQFSMEEERESWKSF